MLFVTFASLPMGRYPQHTSTLSCNRGYLFIYRGPCDEPSTSVPLCVWWRRLRHLPSKQGSPENSDTPGFFQGGVLDSEEADHLRAAKHAIQPTIAPTSSGTSMPPPPTLLDPDPGPDPDPGAVSLALSYSTSALAEKSIGSVTPKLLAPCNDDHNQQRHPDRRGTHWSSTLVGGLADRLDFFFFGAAQGNNRIGFRAERGGRAGGRAGG